MDATNIGDTTSTDATTTTAEPEDTREVIPYSRTFFPATDKAKAAELIGKMLNKTAVDDNKQPIKLEVYGYKSDGTKVLEWPEPAGVMFLPFARNRETTQTVDGKPETVKQRVYYGYLVWPWYDFKLAMAHKDGEQFFADLWADKQADMAMLPLRKAPFENLGKTVKVKLADGTEVQKAFELDLSSVPVTLDKYLSIGGAERGIVKPFAEIGPKILDALKKKYPFLAPVNIHVFRQLLSVKAIAMQMFPKVETAGLFVAVIKKLSETAVKAGQSRELFDRWIETRDTATVATEADSDISSDLSDLAIS